MKITNSSSLLVLSGLIASCGGGGGMSANVDKTFNSPGAFESLISNAQPPNTQSKNIENNQLQEPALTENEIIKNKKLDYLKQLSNQGLVDIECNSTGCVSLTEGIGMKGEHVINADYFVDNDSIKAFKPDATLSGITTYKADTIVKTRYGYNPSPIKNHKGTMELNIDNKTGWGNAKTSIKNISGYDDVKDIDIEYKNIDYTNDNFNSSDVKLINGSTGKKFQSYEAWNISGNINGNLSGESNSTGNFNIKADILKTPFELKGIFSGKEKTVDKNGYIDCGAPKCP